VIICEIDPRHPQPRRVKQVVDFVRAGELIAYPTDTVYAIGCDLLQKRSIERVYALKGQTSKRPMSLLCADLRHASEYAVITDRAFVILRRILPGPYTIVLRAGEKVPKVMLSRQRTVGIRVPDHPVPQAILHELGHPLLTTSCPQEEGVYPNDAREIGARLWAELAAVVDSGPIPNEPSTVLDLSQDDAPLLLRQGRGDASFLEIT
jgi:tRNA threonylcarbamoyl adenosine modification protein (Sua5/YciO/YrdC/YwlC family)